MKIYNGLRFFESDLLKIFEAIHALRAPIFEMMIEMRKTWTMRRCIEIIDELYENGAGDDVARDPEGILMRVHNELWERERQVTRDFAERDPEIDVEFNICILPFEGRVYGMVFTEKRELQKMLFDSGIVEEWGYWNNADPDEDVSEEEWSERERVWNAIFARDAAARPSACGMTMDFPIPLLIVHASDVLERMPSKEIRAADRASRRVASAEYARICADPANARGRHGDIIKFMKTEAAEKLVQAETERLMKVLPDITKEILI